MKWIAKVLGFFLILNLLFTEYACKKQEETIVFRDTIISGNKAPDFNGVSTIKVEGFINKAYIDFCGRKPYSSELDVAKNILKVNPKDTGNKSIFIQSLERKRAYYRRLSELLNIKLINGIDSVKVMDQINTNKYQLALVKAQHDYLAQAYFSHLIYYNSRLIQGVDSLYLHNLPYNEVVALYLKSYFYDEINMGAENYVKACFQNLLYRLPNKMELAQGIELYDNRPSQLFLKPGVSKSDLINIIINSEEFYQGYILDCYYQLLQRKASSKEIYLANQKLFNSTNYKRTKREIAITEEYAGF